MEKHPNGVVYDSTDKVPCPRCQGFFVKPGYVCDACKQLEKEEDFGMKFSDVKVDFHLLPLPALVEWSEAYNHGADKYEPWNWLKGRMFSDYFNSAKRHLLAFNAGEDRDPASGCHHLAQVMFACASMITFQAWGRNDLDDRKAMPKHVIRMMDDSRHKKNPGK